MSLAQLVFIKALDVFFTSELLVFYRLIGEKFYDLFSRGISRVSFLYTAALEI